MSNKDTKGRVANAFRAMKAIGISEVKVKPVLKNLLKVYDKNWELIEEENYRVLADAIFERDEAEAVERSKKIDNAEARLKKIADTNEPHLEEDAQETEEPERPLKRLRLKYRDGQGSSNAANNSVQKMPLIIPKDEPVELPESSRPEPTTSQGKSPQLNGEKTKGNSQAVTGQSNGKNKGKQQISPKAGEKRPVIASQSVCLKEPVVQPKQKSIVSSALIIPKDEPVTDGMPYLGIHPDSSNSLSRNATVRGGSLNPFVNEKGTDGAAAPKEPGNNDPSTGGDSPTRNGTVRGVEGEPRNNAELAITSDQCSSNIEIASSPLGEVKISFSCNFSLARPDFHVETVLKSVEEKYLSSYKILDTNFSIMNIMKGMCQCFLEAGSNSNSEALGASNATPTTDTPKISNLPPQYAPGSLNGTVDPQLDREATIALTPLVPSTCNGIDDVPHLEKMDDRVDHGTDMESSEKMDDGVDRPTDIESRDDGVDRGTETESTEKMDGGVDRGTDVESRENYAGITNNLNLVVALHPQAIPPIFTSLHDGVDHGTDIESTENCARQTNDLSLVIAPQPQEPTSAILSLHDAFDIAKGQENVVISLLNEVNSECPPSFHYIPQNAVFQKASVDFSLARIGDNNCYYTCIGDCLSSSTLCACVRETGGQFAYTADGLVKDELIEKCISMNRDPNNDCQFFCEECPLERSKREDITEPCKGHLVRRFIKECWWKCGCSKQCGNRVVQRGITRNLQVFMTPEGKGWGLRTLENLPKGSFVCEYVGEVLTNKELFDRVSRSSKGDEYLYPVILDADWGAEGALKDEEALCLDATHYGNVSRFINHTCYDSNLVEIPVEVETPDRRYYHLAFFTTREVKAMEELTWDYGIDFDDHEHPIKSFSCLCGSNFCRNIKRSRSRAGRT